MLPHSLWGKCKILFSRRKLLFIIFRNSLVRGQKTLITAVQTSCYLDKVVVESIHALLCKDPIHRYGLNEWGGKLVPKVVCFPGLWLSKVVCNHCEGWMGDRLVSVLFSANITIYAFIRTFCRRLLRNKRKVNPNRDLRRRRKKTLMKKSRHQICLKKMLKL